MTLRRTGEPFRTRYSPGADEYVLAEFDEAMSLETNLVVQQVAAHLDALRLTGVSDVCPANVSYLLRYDPDATSFEKLLPALTEAESDVRAQGLSAMPTRLIELPILFDDPWTHEVVMRFRDRVQEPSLTDLGYLAKLNGHPSSTALIDAIEQAPGIVTMTGYIPGVLCTYALVEREHQVEAPKYLRPRTETPERALGFGGTSRVVYPVPSAGGFPLVGRAAAPIWDPQRRLPDFQDDPALVRLGDVYSYRAIDRAEYDEIQDAVAAGTWTYRQCEITFDPQELFADAPAYCRRVKEALSDD